MKHEKITATFPLLQSDADQAIEAVDRFVNHAMSIRDHVHVFKPAEDQAKRIADRLRHAAELADQLARLQ